jgi:hypothetical protein
MWKLRAAPWTVSVWVKVLHIYKLCGRWRWQSSRSIRFTADEAIPINKESTEFFKLRYWIGRGGSRHPAVAKNRKLGFFQLLARYRLTDCDITFSNCDVYSWYPVRYVHTGRRVIYCPYCLRSFILRPFPGQGVKREEVKTERVSNEKCRKEDNKEGKCV